MSGHASAPAWLPLCAALLLASCGKPTVENNQGDYGGGLANTTGTMGDLGTNLQSVMPATWPGAPIVAGRLTKADAFTMDLEGFSLSAPLICDPPRTDGTGEIHCQAPVTDSNRNGQATIEILLFDQPQDFDTLQSQLKNRVFESDGAFPLQSNPDITVSKKDSPEKTKLPTACYQQQGASNTVAACIFGRNEHVFVVATVQPLEASTESLTFGKGAQSDVNRDLDHASDLASYALLKMDDAL